MAQPRKQPHPLAGFADFIKRRGEGDLDPFAPGGTPTFSGEPVDFSPQEPNAAEKFAPMPAPQAPPQTMADRYMGQAQSTESILAGPTAGGLGLHFAADPQMRDRSVPGVAATQNRPMNERPELHGNSLADWEDYNRQAESYKPENHNSRITGIVAQALRGFADRYNQTGDFWQSVGGAGAGGVAAAIDPSQDEYYHNENYAKPRSVQGLARAMQTEKDRTGIQSAESLNRERDARTKNLGSKPQRDAVTTSIKALQRYKYGEDPEYDQWLESNGFKLQDFDKRNGGKPIFRDSAGKTYQYNMDTGRLEDTGIIDASKAPNAAGLLPKDEMTRIEREADRKSRESEGALNRSSREGIAANAESGRNRRADQSQAGMDRRHDLQGAPVPRSAVIAKANKIKAADPDGTMTFAQAYEKAAAEVYHNKGTIADDPPPVPGQVEAGVGAP